MTKKIDVIIQATDRMSPVIDQVGQEVESLGDKIVESARDGENTNKGLALSFEKISTGITIAGAAMSLYAKSQQEVDSLASRTAIKLGMTGDEFNNLAKDVSDVSLPVRDAVELLALAGSQGLKTGEELKSSAKFWSTLADASGSSAIELAKMSGGLRAMGISAGEESQSLNAYGIILQNTSLDLVKFNELAAKNSQVARAHNMTIDDLAATYAYMSNELGFTAEMMESEFETVITSSTTAINKYKSTLGDTTNVVNQLAEAHDESFGLLDKFKNGISELSIQYRDQIQIAGDFGSIMTGIGAASKAAAFFQGLYSAAVATTGVASAAAAPGMVTFGAGVVAATWPILAIVAAIALVVGAIYLLVKHFDTLKKGVSNTFNWMAENSKIILPLIFGPMFYMIDAVIKAIKWIGQNWDTVMQGMAKAVKIAVDVITLPFKIMVNGIIAGINLIIDAINFLGGSLERLEAFDLKVGDMNFSKSSQQTINVNTTTTLDGRAIAKSTASTTRRIAGSNN